MIMRNSKNNMVWINGTVLEVSESRIVVRPDIEGCKRDYFLVREPGHLATVPEVGAHVRAICHVFASDRDDSLARLVIVDCVVVPARAAEEPETEAYPARLNRWQAVAAMSLVGQVREKTLTLKEKEGYGGDGQLGLLLDLGPDFGQIRLSRMLTAETAAGYYSALLLPEAVAISGHAIPAEGASADNPVAKLIIKDIERAEVQSKFAEAS